MVAVLGAFAASLSPYSPHPGGLSLDLGA